MLFIFFEKGILAYTFWEYCSKVNVYKYILLHALK